MLRSIAAIYILLCVGVQSIRLHDSPNSLLSASLGYGRSSRSTGRTTFSALLAGEIGRNVSNFDSHSAVDSIPESLVKDIDGNAGMRAKFEKLCRKSQVKLDFGLSFLHILIYVYYYILLLLLLLLF
jgi:hypothetical protein